MIRQVRFATYSTDLEGAMTEREEALREVGIDLNFTPLSETTAFSLEANGFSGYGEFTPITILSYTLPKDADLERDKQRN